jgi:hypothetical protein
MHCAPDTNHTIAAIGKIRKRTIPKSAIIFAYQQYNLLTYRLVTISEIYTPINDGHPECVKTKI